jgi:uncharacterized membrane protein
VAEVEVEVEIEIVDEVVIVVAVETNPPATYEKLVSTVTIANTNEIENTTKSEIVNEIEKEIERTTKTKVVIVTDIILREEKLHLHRVNLIQYFPFVFAMADNAVNLLNRKYLLKK